MAAPTRDVLLIPYSINWNTRIVAAPADYGLTASQATAYTGLHTPYITAAQAAAEPGQKSKSLIAARNSAKAALLPYLRELYAFIQANTQVSDQNKVDLGITLRHQRSPVPPPNAAPELSVVSVFGRQMRLSIRDASHTRRGRPVNCAGASLFSFIGETPPAGDVGWKAEGNVTKNVVNVDFPESVVPGTKVWFTACWYIQRGGLTGPACTPIWAHVGYEGAEPLAA